MIRDTLVSSRKLSPGIDCWNVLTEDFVIDGYTRNREKDGELLRGVKGNYVCLLFFILKTVLRNVFSE